MSPPETFTEPSLWPDIAPDRLLGEVPDVTATIRPADQALLDSLRSIGIVHEGEQTVHFGRVTARVGAMLYQASADKHDASTPHAYWWDEDEYWAFRPEREPLAIAAKEGYIESCKLVEIDGRLQPALRLVNLITDMGIDDTLVLLSAIERIETVPPQVSRVLIIHENNQADGTAVDDPASPAAYWQEKIDQYFKAGPVYKTIWTPETGSIAAW